MTVVDYLNHCSVAVGGGGGGGGGGRIFGHCSVTLGILSELPEGVTAGNYQVHCRR